jgi:hypothetical protein
VSSQREVLIGIAAATIATAVVFLAALAIAALRRWRGGQLGRAYGRFLAFLAGVMFGTMILVGAADAANLIVAAFVLWLAVLAWRRGRRTDAGLLVAGAALPWTTLWSIYAWAGLEDVDPASEWNGVVVGAVPLAIGLGMAALGDRRPPARRGPTGWQPGARTIGTIATAIRGTTSTFGSQEIAAVIALVAVLLAGGLLTLGLGIDRAYAWIVPTVLASIAASEAYIRALPPFNRKAFEAYSWLGEDELRRLRAQTGGGPPLNARAAARWLERHGKDPALAWVLPEVFLLAGRNADARRAAELMTEDTPFERVERESARSLVAWMDGRDADLGDLAAAVEALPDDTDERLKAEVVLAAARTRHRMSDGRTEPGDAALPLVEVRERLGHRADGRVGRALRPRILPMYLALSVGLGVLQSVLVGLALDSTL